MIPLIFLLSILMGASGALFMKIGAGHMSHVEVHSFMQLVEFMVRLLMTPAMLLGVALYFCSAMAWSYLLTKLDISFVQPILALTYVATPLLAIFFLHEHVPAVRWIGILIIVFGVFVVARTSA